MGWVGGWEVPGSAPWKIDVCLFEVKEKEHKRGAGAGVKSQISWQVRNRGVYKFRGARGEDCREGRMRLPTQKNTQTVVRSHWKPVNTTEASTGEQKTILSISSIGLCNKCY